VTDSNLISCTFCAKLVIKQSFQWMSRVLQAVDSIHQVGIYCLALVPPNSLPKTPLGGIHLSETRRRFLEGSLHPANVLMCPHTCVTNLPKPREVHQGTISSTFADVDLVSRACRLTRDIQRDSACCTNVIISLVECSQSVAGQTKHGVSNSCYRSHTLSR
jgi:hypothetical protein